MKQMPADLSSLLVLAGVTKNFAGFLVSEALNMCLKLVAPGYVHKAWKYYNQYCCYLESKDVDVSLFS